MRPPDFDVLPIAVRAFAVRAASTGQPTDVSRETDRSDPSAAPAAVDGQAKRRDRGRLRLRRYPTEALVFDTETTDDPEQRLLVGVWRFYRDGPDQQPGSVCVEEGFFYADDLPETRPEEFAVLRSYVQTRQASVSPGMAPEFQLMSTSDWVERRLHLYGYEHRDRCSVVGFNLPFDLGALARHWGSAQGFYRGGWSLDFWGRHGPDGAWQNKPGHPRLRMKAIDPRRTLFQWGGLRDGKDDGRGSNARFLDLHTLAFALTDRNYTLERACTAFGDPFEKAAVDYGVVDDRMLDYALADVRHTAVLYRNCLAELARHPDVELEAHRLYSPATVGAAYLRAMGVQQPLAKYADLDPRVHGWAMCAFYGGRAEARIVRTPVPVVVADFTSMYPAQNALLNTWPLLVAERLAVDDVTKPVRGLVGDPELIGRLYDRLSWSADVGVTLVELDEIDGARLPVRAGYDPNANDFGIGVNPLRYQGRLWYALPDVLAAVLLGPAAFHIRQALRLRPVGSQTGLQPVSLRGARRVDPSTEDPFVAMIEERHRVKRDLALDAAEKKRLDLFLKITANATAYGSLARFDRRELGAKVALTVYGPGEPFADRKTDVEDPGPYCFPPVAASITAGARLILAMLQRAVTDAGGSYAFMDTDSTAIVATPDGGPVDCRTREGNSLHALSHRQVYGLLLRFEPLNPFGPDVRNDDPRLGRSPWKIEHDSVRNPLTCYVIASKRYVLYREAGSDVTAVAAVERHEEASSDTSGGDAEDREYTDWSEHGLGLYIDPLGTEQPKPDGDERRLWMRDAWQWVLSTARGGSRPLPAWADRLALTRFTVSSPKHASWFAIGDGPEAGRPRPGSFGLLAHPAPLLAGASGGALPAAPYDRDASRWPDLDWYDRRTGTRMQVTGADPTQEPAWSEALAVGAFPVRSLGQVLATYRMRPEHKSLDPDGTAAGGRTEGQLLPRPVQGTSTRTLLVGKEGNKLLERLTGELTDPADYRTTYGDPDRTLWHELVVPVLQEIGVAELAQRLDLSQRRINDWLRGHSEPHAGRTSHRQKAIGIAAAYAADRLKEWGCELPVDPGATLHAYLLQRQEHVSVAVCAGCRQPIDEGRQYRLFAVKREAGGPGGLVTRRLPRWRAEYGAGSSPGSESRGRSA